MNLGADGGFDCSGRPRGGYHGVIGVDMTPEMVSKARANTNREQFPHVDFRLGEIEHLPIADKTADVVISNCVINLSTDKPQVFREAFRILRPGGRLAISDVVAKAELPEAMRSDLALVAGCVGNAALVREYEEALAGAGFTEIRINPKMRHVRSSKIGFRVWGLKTMSSLPPVGSSPEDKLLLMPATGCGLVAADSGEAAYIAMTHDPGHRPWLARSK